MSTPRHSHRLEDTAARPAASSRHLQHALVIALTSLALAGCASKGSDSATGTMGLNAQSARITDQRIAADQQTLARAQERLKALSTAGVPQNNYALAKAQCWLNTATTQYAENDRTSYIEEALGQSMQIIQALEADKNTKAGQDTPLIAGSQRLREDLWSQLGAYKNQSATLVCNGQSVACAEVALVRAGHAQEQTGWRAATVYVKMAEDGLRRAQSEAASCAPPAPAPKVAAAPVPPAPAPAPAPVVTKETYTLLSDALFAYKKSGLKDMLPGGQERLRTLAERLKGYKSVESLSILGHTDRLGGAAYNDKLSQKRADTVRDYLTSQGVKAQVLIASGVGEREPVTKGCSTKAPKAQQIACLQPDRRVTIEISGVAK